MKKKKHLHSLIQTWKNNICKFKYEKKTKLPIIVYLVEGQFTREKSATTGVITVNDDVLDAP